MRPVRLDLNGFASFRDPAVVDFTDADYFAVVGSTGSGKSTVIDAMTFALYGTAHRWGRSNAVADALAPTANRCTVRLVFDIGNARYAVTREVRRTTQQVQQKSAVLERFADPTATGDAAEGVVDSDIIAADIKDVKAAVEDLLGLSFEDFCQCVVLPQGEFAAFLKATAKERQAILLKLLGAAHYEGIGKLAGQRAAAAAQTIKVLTEQLAGHADATQNAEDTACSREHTLTDLVAIVDKELPAIEATTAQVTEARDRRDRLTAEHDQLAAVTSPAGVIELQTSMTAAEQEYRQASETDANATDAAAKAANAVKIGPDRHRVEQAIANHTELADLNGRRESVEQAVNDANQKAGTSARRVEETAGALMKARTDRDQARIQSATAQTGLATVTRRRSQLAAVTTPDTVADLGARAQAARAQHETATATAGTAAKAAAAAAETLEQLPARAALTQAADDLAVYQTTEQGLTTRTRARAAAETEAAYANTALGAADDAVTAAQAAYEQARAGAGAADLRPHLQVGHACPVCDQTVATLPPPLAAPEVDAAQTRLQAAEAARAPALAAHTAASRALTDTNTAAQVASGKLEHLDQSLARLLPDRPAGVGVRDVVADRAAVTADLAGIDEATRHRRALEQNLAAARTAEKAAADALVAVDKDTGTARGQLHTVRGPMIAYGAPDVDDTDLPAAWALLSSWANGQVAALDGTTIPDAQQQLDTATALLAEAEETLANVETAQHAAVDARTQASVAAEQAAGAQRAFLDRVSVLDNLLAGAPSPDEAGGLLEECTRLEKVAADATAAWTVATGARRAAEKARDEWRTTVAQAWSELSTTRDQLVHHGAPVVDGADIAAAWITLTTWATAQAQQRAIDLTQAEKDATTTAQGLADQVAALDIQLAKHGVGEDRYRDQLAADPAGVRQVVAVELERAKAATAAIVKSRAQTVALQKKIKRATEANQVASQLANLMRSTNFPQWLANAALDTLVADASSSLRRLSGDQYDLTHEKGDFFVIDHTDADSRRSVRTLSGGETFQASLALALALSEQLASLAAGGTAKLDSIFLDEGFGTLDPDSLETVAGTLENLAQGERMVGVITHVAALAERAPVRYLVHRDSRSSTVTREGT